MHRPLVPCCVLLDVSLGADGLELQRQVALTIAAPIVFLTGHHDVRVIVQAMRAGAVDVLAEPVNPEQLLGAIRAAIERSRAALDREAAMRDMGEHYASLTPREREAAPGSRITRACINSSDKLGRSLPGGSRSNSSTPAGNAVTASVAQVVRGSSAMTNCKDCVVPIAMNAI